MITTGYNRCCSDTSTLGRLCPMDLRQIPRQKFEDPRQKSEDQRAAGRTGRRSRGSGRVVVPSDRVDQPPPDTRSRQGVRAWLSARVPARPMARYYMSPTALDDDPVFQKNTECGRFIIELQCWRASGWRRPPRVNNPLEMGVAVRSVWAYQSSTGSHRAARWALPFKRCRQRIEFRGFALGVSST